MTATSQKTHTHALPTMPTAVTGPVLTIIMDGVGSGPPIESNAVWRARTPHLNALAQSPLSATLSAHGMAVGMPSNADMGNSEVGHNALGAGRIFAQGAKLVADAIADGGIFQKRAWTDMVQYLSTTGGCLHFLGLLSDGNVHSHIDHLKAMISRAAGIGLRRVAVHALLDGRDVSRRSAFGYIENIEQHLKECARSLQSGPAEERAEYHIASAGGRMTTTMDRYGADWSMVERGWRVQVLGEGRQFPSLLEAVGTLRDEQPGIGDQDLGPVVIGDSHGQPRAPIEDGDAVVLFNFRGDRMLQCCQAFESPLQSDIFDKFDRVRRPNIYFCGMTLYDGDTHTPGRYLVSPPEIQNTLSELLCNEGVTQLACSETQKFGHVTYFWNGNRSGYFDEGLETYIEIPSNAAPFDARPEMKAREIAEAVLKILEDGKVRCGRLNLANGDMVGHTGNFDATLRAVEVVDEVVGMLVSAVLRMQGACIITADHGNADDMAEHDKSGQILRDPQGQWLPKTSHSLNPVPFYLALPQRARTQYTLANIENPGLGHVAATIAQLLGFRCPESFLPSLIRCV